MVSDKTINQKIKTINQMNKIILSLVILVQINTFCMAQDVLKVTSGSVVTVQNGADLFVSGGIILDANSTFNNTGIVTISVTGVATADFTDNNITAYNYGTGKFLFSGTGIQNIKSANQFERIDIDNNGLNFLSDINSNTWYLKAGKVNTGSFIAVANSTAAAAVKADATNTNFANSWINGNLRRFVTPASVNNYQFPVGDAARVNIAEMDNLTANPLTGISYVTVSFGLKPGTDVGLNVSENGTAYNAVNNAGVWYVVPDANPGAGKYDIKLFFNGFTGLADNSFGILRRPDASSNAVDWIVPIGSALPASGTTGRTVAGSYAQRNDMTTFSQFAIGSSLSALPLQLLSFNAVKKDKAVLLQWTTANEINTSHFELYRAGQLVPQQYLDKVAAAGSSNTNRSYSYSDLKPLKGVNFYQLKMVDINNSYKFSSVVKLNFDEMTSFNVYPNPVTTNILFVDYAGGKVNGVKLITADGKQIACNFSNQSNSQLKVSIPSLIAKGAYILQLITKEGIKSSKIFVQ